MFASSNPNKYEQVVRLAEVDNHKGVQPFATPTAWAFIYTDEA